MTNMGLCSAFALGDQGKPRGIHGNHEATTRKSHKIMRKPSGNPLKGFHIRFLGRNQRPTELTHPRRGVLRLRIFLGALISTDRGY